jgi:hypothetical protein
MPVVLYRTDEFEVAGVTLSAAQEAVVCGALGCRDGEQLTEVECSDGRRRVLCREHTFEIIRQERAAEVDGE